MPPTKKRKTEVERYICQICQSEKTSNQFPDFNPSRECEHMIHTCKWCLKKWVEVQVESSEFVKKTGVAEVADGAENDADWGEMIEGNGDGKVGKDGTPKGLLFGVKCPHPKCEGVSIAEVSVEDMRDTLTSCLPLSR
jgi:hypothetical protein